MAKKYLEKLKGIVAKLETANDKEAHRILRRLLYGDYSDSLYKASLELAGKDFSISHDDAVDLISRQILKTSLSKRLGIAQGWYNAEAPDEFLYLILDCVDLKKIKLIITLAKWKEKKNANPFSYFDKGATDDQKPLPPPPDLAAIIAGLNGFSEIAPGKWERLIGGAKNLTEFKRKIKPVYEEVYNILDAFGNEWGTTRKSPLAVSLEHGEFVVRFKDKEIFRISGDVNDPETLRKLTSSLQKFMLSKVSPEDMLKIEENGGIGINISELELKKLKELMKLQ